MTSRSGDKQLAGISILRSPPIPDGNNRSCHPWPAQPIHHRSRLLAARQPSRDPAYPLHHSQLSKPPSANHGLKQINGSMGCGSSWQMANRLVGFIRQQSITGRASPSRTGGIWAAYPIATQSEQRVNEQ
ncbi:hypothetical protein ACLOJK_036327, partial [Asimina triloba]